MKALEGDWELSLPGDKDFKQKLRELNTKKELFERLLHIVPEGLMVVDTALSVVFMNQGARNLLSSDLWLEGDKIQQDPCPLTAMLHETQNLDFLTYQRDVEIFEPSYKYLSIFCVPLPDYPEQPCRAFLIKDLTREKLAAAENNCNPTFTDSLTFGAGIAHELGNPIASLGIHAQILERLLNKNKRSTKEEDQMRQSVGVLNAELGRLDQTIDSFLDAVRPSNPQFKLVDMDHLIQGTVSMLEGKAGACKVELIFQPSHEPPLLMDPIRIGQALTNIMLNAIEASKPGKRVEIRALVKKDSFEVHIQDYGVGMQTDDMVKIFDPFYTTKETGNGLGLLISYRVMRDHGGNISVKSRPDEGTTFVLSLPVRRKAVNQLPAQDKNTNS